MIGILLACVPLLSVGCVEQVAVEYSFSGLGWVQRLRPDMAPLDSGQMTDQAAYFTDGGEDGRGLVSALYPDTPLGRSGTLRTAHALWIAQGTPIRVSYQAIIQDPRFNGQRLRETAGSVAGPLGPAQRPAQATVSMRGVTTPIHRHLLGTPAQLGDVILTPELIQGSWFSTPIPLAVALETCTGGLALSNRDSPPDGLDQRCARPLVTAALCGSTTHPNTLFPATVLRCQIIPDQDASYRLRVMDASAVNRTGEQRFPRTSQPPLGLRPDVKVIGGPRILLRELTPQPEECLAPNPPETTPRPCNEAELAALRLWRHCNQVPQTVPPGTTFPSCPDGRPGNPRWSAPGFAQISRRWTFSVADANSGQWRENFADNLRINRIRIVYVNNARPNSRRYVNANDGSAVGLAELRAASGFASYSCTASTEGGVGNAHADPSNCNRIFNRLSNPAWMADDPSRPIEWRVVFRQDASNAEVGQHCQSVLVCSMVNDRQVCLPRQRCTPVTAEGVLTRDMTFRPEAGDRLFLEFEMERGRPQSGRSAGR